MGGVLDAWRATSDLLGMVRVINGEGEKLDLSITLADEKRIRHSCVRRAKLEGPAPAKAKRNLGWRSFCIALDTRLRGYDVSHV